MPPHNCVSTLCVCVREIYDQIYKEYTGHLDLSQLLLFLNRTKRKGNSVLHSTAMERRKKLKKQTDHRPFQTLKTTRTTDSHTSRKLTRQRTS